MKHLTRRRLKLVEHDTPPITLNRKNTRPCPPCSVTQDCSTPTPRAGTAVVNTIGPAVVSVHAGKRVHGPGRELQGSGSGVAIMPDGYILTNSHVVEVATQLAIAWLRDTMSKRVWSANYAAGSDVATVRRFLEFRPGIGHS